MALNGGAESGGAENSGVVGADEVLTIQDNCPNCQSPVETKMKLVGILKKVFLGTQWHNSYVFLCGRVGSLVADPLTLWCVADIPHFKEVVIMASNCEYCGHRSNEVKSGSGISDMGTKITLKLTDASDLNRDILKVC